MKGWFLPGFLLIGLFAATRVAALQVQFHDSDVNLYARYAAECQAAQRQGESFYDVHRRQAQTGSAEYQSVEYPPLAVSLMNVPAWLIAEPFEQDFPTGLQPRYTRAYIGLMAGLDLATLALVLVLVRRLYPEETRFEQWERCLVYVVCTWPLYGVLYTRLDLGVAVLVTAALTLLVCRLHWCLSFAVLALAIHFKLMPMVLAPLWIIASLPVAALRSWREIASGLMVRSGVLIAFGLAILAPYFLAHGPAVLEFLDYHKERGIEIESTWASLLMLRGDFGVYHSHGSVNVSSPWSPLLTALATPVLAALLAGATFLFFWAVRQRSETAESNGETVAQRWPRLVAGFALLLLLISIVANKVFSPQYLLWVLPLIPLVDLKTRPRRILFVAILAVCFLTMRIFPDCFVGEIVRVVSGEGDVTVLNGPTPYGAFLLFTRNALFLAITGALAAALVRGVRKRTLKYSAFPFVALPITAKQKQCV